MAAVRGASEGACELRFGQVGLACVRLRLDDALALREDLARRVAAAPTLFARAAVVLDLSRLPALPDDDRVRALLEAVRMAGMLPVALAYGSSEVEALAQRLDLPLIARFRDASEREAGGSAAAGANSAGDGDETLRSTRLHGAPVRSGQQVYAQGRDLTVTASVANGAELIADGSIHVYGRLNGRALAGAVGATDARIFCTDFRAELVSIAGHYRVFEQMPPLLAGKAVQCWLDGDRLFVEPL
ncbi:MAG TPA: septum site-determining protein MinC [Rhodanobacteraceae bacterium]|nr:septum site-determining protein MinC [Rhodanobacteraceae bacterium]